MKNPYKIFFLTLIILTSILQSNTYSQLSGSYAVGNGGNYPTIDSAVNDLVNNGVSGPVIFNIRPGTYNESVTIDSIKGVSQINTVTFRSQNGNSQTVTWYTDDPVMDAHALLIDRADFLIFQDLTFIGDTAGFNSRKIIDLKNNSTNISFINNVFKTNNTFFETTYIIYCSGINNNDLEITDNDFISIENPSYEGNNEGIKIDGKADAMGSERVEIYNNTFIDFVSAISVSNTDSLLIEKNMIHMGNVAHMNHGIEVRNCNDQLRILKNRITSSYSCNSSITGFALSIEDCINSLIANNFILFKGGIAVFGVRNFIQKYIYNTIASFGAQCPSNMYISGSGRTILKNNIYVNFNLDPYGQGVPYTINNTILSSDHNNFYYLAPRIANYDGVNVTDLQSWRNITGNDINSNDQNVSFISNYDLHLQGQSIGDYDLKGVPSTEVSDDIDGNPRDPLFPSMGADEPIYPSNIYINLSVLIEGFYDAGSNSTVEDTISVYLRKTSAPYNIMDSSKAWLVPAGKASVRFYNADSGNYYIIVKHRNGLETWSKNGGENLVKDSMFAYDFTSSAAQAFGNNLILKGSKYCIYSGNINQDDAIDLTDVINIFNNSNSFLTGYVNSDINGDMIVDLQDVIPVYNNSTEFVNLKRP